MALLSGAEREEMTAALAALPSTAYDALAGGGEKDEGTADASTETKADGAEGGKEGEKPAEGEGGRARGPDGKFLPKDKAEGGADDGGKGAAPPAIGGKPADKPADPAASATQQPAFTPGQNVEWARYEAIQKQAEESAAALEKLKADNAALAAQMRMNREYGLGPTGQPVQQPQQQAPGGVSQEQVDRVLADLFPNEDVRSTLHPDVAKHLAEQAIWRNQFENNQRASMQRAQVAAERSKLEQQIAGVQTKYPRAPREVFVVALMQNGNADLETVAEKFYREHIVPIRQEGFAEAEAKYKATGSGPQAGSGGPAVPPNVRTAPSGAGKPAGVAGPRTDLPKKASDRIAFVADLLSQRG